MEKMFITKGTILTNCNQGWCNYGDLSMWNPIYNNKLITHKKTRGKSKWKEAIWFLLKEDLKERGWSTLEISDIILVRISKGMDDSWWICKYIQVVAIHEAWCLMSMFQTLFWVPSFISSFEVSCFEVLKHGTHFCPSFSNSNFSFNFSRILICLLILFLDFAWRNMKSKHEEWSKHYKFLGFTCWSMKSKHEEWKKDYKIWMWNPKYKIYIQHEINVCWK